MGKLEIHLCPETGICSVLKGDGSKVDMMPGEVDQVRQAKGDQEQIKSVFEDIDASFTSGLGSEELGQLADELK